MKRWAPCAVRAGVPCCVSLLGAFVYGCATLTPVGAQVKVYQAPLDALPPQRSMPTGCRLVATRPHESMTELDMEGQKDPFPRERNEAAAAGANALLVLKRMVVGRRDPECPGASPITDCPPSLGAWFDVVVESYTCTPGALLELSMLPPDRTREFSHTP